MSSRRRNGKVASCEPCRKDKVRCDHAVPTCGRCQLRGVSGRCYYHPAPLTRRRDRLPGPVTAAMRARRLTPSTPSSPGLSNSDGHSLICNSTDKHLQSGYLGPTSFISPFPGGTELDPSTHNAERPSMDQLLPPYWIQKTSEALELLREFPIIEQLICEFYDESQSALIAAPLILNTLRPVREMYDDALDRDLNSHIPRLTTTIIQNTAETFDVASTVAGYKFHTLFTGSQIRLEIIGVLYSLAGRAALFGLASNKFFSPRRSAAARIEFGQKMLDASDKVLHVCKILTSINDLTLWLLYEDLLLTSLLHGYSSSMSWNRLGELSTDIFLLGIHRDPTIKGSSYLPPFLVESRRRLFAASYQLDKNIATFLGRPPRISWRHADCKLPLDVSDEALASDKSDLELAQARLDKEGWNTDGVYRKSSWIRLRFLVTIFREEILELSHQTPGPETVEKLNDISHRSRTAWESIPGHLRYTPQTWNDNLPLGVSIMLIVTYLAYHYNEFLIQRLLIQQNPFANEALLNVSSIILSAVLVLGTQREHMSAAYRDFIETILLYGFPTACVLINALQAQTHSNCPFPYTGSRSQLIRNLSVFISHLDSTIRPGNVNFEILSRASRALSETIDEILEPKTGNAHERPNEDVFDIGELGSMEDPNFLNTMDFGVVLDQWLV